MSRLSRALDRAFGSSLFMLAWCLVWVAYGIATWDGWWSVLYVGGMLMMAAAFGWLWWARRRLRRRP